MLEVSQEQLVEYQDKIKQQSTLINQVQERNKQLASKLEHVLNDKSILEDKFENYQSSRLNEHETNTNLALSQKIEYLQNDVRTLTNDLQAKEEDYQLVLDELGKRILLNWYR
jgi:septation ring formation regulator EzrA